MFASTDMSKARPKIEATPAFVKIQHILCVSVMYELPKYNTLHRIATANSYRRIIKEITLFFVNKGSSRTAVCLAYKPISTLLFMALVAAAVANAFRSV